jgi:predicted transcriptional regulator
MKYQLKIVNSLEEHHKELCDRLDCGELDKNPETNIVMTPEVFSKVFTPERIKLLHRIYRNKIKNIYQLAREMGKPYEVVFRNIKYLEGTGLVRIKTIDNKKIPYFNHKFSIDMFPKEAVKA